MESQGGQLWPLVFIFFLCGSALGRAILSLSHMPERMRQEKGRETGRDRQWLRVKKEMTAAEESLWLNQTILFG